MASDVPIDVAHLLARMVDERRDKIMVLFVAGDVTLEQANEMAVRALVARVRRGVTGLLGTESPAELRQWLIALVEAGRVNWKRAISAAGKIGAAPLEIRRPTDVPADDRWSLMQAVAWIVWQSLEIVELFSDEYRRRCEFFWDRDDLGERTTTWRMVRGSPVSLALALNWEKHLDRAEPWFARVEDGGDLPPARMSLSDAREELFRAGREGAVSATGYRSRRETGEAQSAKLVNLKASHWLAYRLLPEFGTDAIGDDSSVITDIRINPISIVNRWSPEPVVPASRPPLIGDVEETGPETLVVLAADPDQLQAESIAVDDHGLTVSVRPPEQAESGNPNAGGRSKEAQRQKRQCLDWLLDQYMRKNPAARTHVQKEVWPFAHEEFPDLSYRAFLEAWNDAANSEDGKFIAWSTGGLPKVPGNAPTDQGADEK